jgi:hypothetical protein
MGVKNVFIVKISEYENFDLLYPNIIPSESLQLKLE